jgi:hypothetical protein
MLAVIAPCINYLSSLKIKKVFEELTSVIKEKRAINFSKYQERISSVFSGS